MLFNPAENDVHKMAKTLSTFFESKVAPILEADKAQNKNNLQRLETMARTLLAEKQRLDKELAEIQSVEPEKDAPVFRPREEFLQNSQLEMDSDEKNKLCEEVENLDSRYSPGLLKLIKEEMGEAQPV